MAFKSSSTIQPAAPKLSKVHFNILNLKNKYGSIYFVFFGISFLQCNKQYETVRNQPEKVHAKIPYIHMYIEAKPQHKCSVTAIIC